jgi:protein TonB
VPPVHLGNEKPKYSASARRKGIEGTVIVVFDVMEDGSVANAQVVSGPEELRESALRTASQWHYQPARRGTRAVRFHTQVRVVFRLDDADA